MPFIEISSRIEPFDIVEAAYLSSMVFNDFPKGSIHILATNVVATSYKGHVVAQFEDHFFIAPDNGILSLIFGADFTDYFLIPTDHYEQKIQNVYLPFIDKLTTNGMDIGQLATKADDIVIKSLLRFHRRTLFFASLKIYKTI